MAQPVGKPRQSLLLAGGIATIAGIAGVVWLILSLANRTSITTQGVVFAAVLAAAGLFSGGALLYTWTKIPPGFETPSDINAEDPEALRNAMDKCKRDK